MNFERRAGGELLKDKLQTKESRDKVRDETFRKYLEKLGLGSRDIVDAEILDVGAGSLAAFGDALQKKAKEEGFDCAVVSIDRARFLDVRSDGVDYDKNFRIGGVNFENLKLRGKMEIAEEPKFNTIVAFNSVPITYAQRGELSDRRWSEKEKEKMRGEIRGFVYSAIDHLKPGGRAIFYPIYKGEIFKAEDTGEERDFSEWRRILEEELALAKKREEDFLNIFFQEVDCPDGIHIHERLIIEKK